MRIDFRMESRDFPSGARYRRIDDFRRITVGGVKLGGVGISIGVGVTVGTSGGSTTVAVGAGCLEI